MKSIVSANNETYKLLVRLTGKRERDKRGVFIIEGEKLIEEAVRCNANIQTVFFRSGGNPKELSVETVSLREDLFDKIADRTEPCGAVAVLERPVRKQEVMRGKNVVILDRLQDPGNVGTVIRTAEAAGFAGVIAVKGTADLWSQKVCRSAAGAIVRMPLFTVEDAGSALMLASELSIEPVVCDMDGESLYSGKSLTGNIALIIGNEGRGISPEFRSASVRAVGIPMSGESESLNAAVAAGIIMYEKKRQEELSGN